MTYRQQRLDGSEFVVRGTPPVPTRVDHEGYVRWRHQYRGEDGAKREDVVGVHRLAAVAWFGLEELEDDAVVHHRNGVPWDNREGNLRVMGRREHTRLHKWGCRDD